MLILGVDTGGTFTDLVLFEDRHTRVHKVLSTPASPERAILAGIHEMGLDQAVAAGTLIVVHGSTVATNAALEGKGVKTLYVANRGFGDVLSIGRQNRTELYSLTPSPRSVPVPPAQCIEVSARTGAAGECLSALTDQDINTVLTAIAQHAPDSVAINLLFSYLNDNDEKRIEQAIGASAFVARSSAVLPEYKEYERGIATWLSAWLGPIVARYLNALRQALGTTPLSIMQSSGGTIDADSAANSAVNLLLSGPAGGLTGALFVGQQIGENRLLSFDMGGTSTDVALINGCIAHTAEGHIGPWPVAVPMVDMHTIGAGGGSIAWLDPAGALHVGPQSAGADPGPACYGRGGQQPTVTDANLILGHLPVSARLGGDLPLDAEAAYQVMNTLAGQLGVSVEEAAAGVIKLANEHMAQALRVISVQRGYALSGFRLCCFGGAGGLHVCALADALNMDHALVPVNAGVLSALGLAVAPRARTLSRSVLWPVDKSKTAQIGQIYADLEAEGRSALHQEGIPDNLIASQRTADVRYRGQSFSLNVPWSTINAVADAFARLHQQRYGHTHALATELVTLRVSLSAQLHSPELETQVPVRPIKKQREFSRIFGIKQPVPVVKRSQLPVNKTVAGPLLITEDTSTTLVSGHWSFRVDHYGNLLLDRN